MFSLILAFKNKTKNSFIIILYQFLFLFVLIKCFIYLFILLSFGNFVVHLSFFI